LPDRRPSAWATAFARRTYLAGILWALGVMTSLVTRVPDHAGWLAIRLDLAGLLYTAAAIIGGANFFGAGWRAARSRRLDMNFLMSVAIVAAVLIGDPSRRRRSPSCSPRRNSWSALPWTGGAARSRDCLSWRRSKPIG
jgi:cation transport ATPase